MDLRLQVQLQSLVLKVAEGKIREIEAGSFALEVTLFWRDHKMISPIQTEPAPLLPDIHLGDGITIP
jgi:hypothetical protein